MTRTWPKDWDDRIAGRDCKMCLQGRSDDSGYGLGFFAGTVSDAYLQRERLARGYTVVAWRGRHVTEPFDLSGPEARAYWREVLIAAKALFRRYQPAKMNYQVLGNAVPHLHTHLVPRYLDDPAPERPLVIQASADAVPEDTLRKEVSDLKEIVQSLLREEGSTESRDCRECGFVWSLPIEEAIALVDGAPDRYTHLLADGVGSRSDDPRHWSATGYLWHIVDVLRFGTERLLTLALDPGSGIPGWDQDAMAEARRYEKLSTAVGIQALRLAVKDWIRVARETPRSARALHPSFGTVTTEDSVRRNAHEVHHHALDIERVLAEPL